MTRSGMTSLEDAAMPTRGDENAARVRAARAYAGIDQKTLADALGVSVQTYKRIESGVRPLLDGDAEVIAKRCGVPRGFLLEGFTQHDPEGQARLELVRRELQALNEKIERLPNPTDETERLRQAVEILTKRPAT
jgi:transcriptional regulator with XRE-family HTH domain